MPFFENNVVKDNLKSAADDVKSHLPSLPGTTRGASVSNNNHAGSGSEVDRYGSYFGLGADGRARIKTYASRAANHQGAGAEQEIHASHFGIDIDEVKKLLMRVEKKADRELHSGGYWMGYDGKQIGLGLASKKGTGAEQDRFAGHFGFDEDTIKAMTDKLAAGAEKVKKSVGA